MSDVNPRRQDRNKAQVPRCPLSLSFKCASRMHYSPATIRLLQEPCRMNVLLNISSLGYPGRGEWENTQVHNLETFPLTASFICRQSPPAAYTSWNKLKCPSSNCSLSNFDPEGGCKFRILGGAIWITKHLYLPFFYGNIIILRNNLLIIREMKNFALQQSWWHSSDMNCKSRYSNSRKRSP